MRTTSIWTLAFSLAVVCGETAWAQFNNTPSFGIGGASGGVTQGTFGATQRGGVTQRQTSSFARGTSANQSRNSGFGNTGFGGSGQFGVNSLSGGQQGMGFVGRNAMDAANFIGARANQSGLGRGQNQFRSGVGGLGGFGGMGGRNMGGLGGQQRRGGGPNQQEMDMADDNQFADQMQAQRRFRTRLVVGFRPEVGAPHVAAALNVSAQRFGRTLERSLGKHVRAELVQGTAVLSGTVTTPQERILAEQLALLEPGISQVQNDLVVGVAPSAPAAADSASPTPTPMAR